MKRTKIVGLCLAVVSAFSAMAAAQSPAIEFIWKVNGSKLEAKAEKELKSKAVGSQVLKGTAFGIPVQITCTKVSTAGAKIIGGFPGTSSETVTYGGCTVQKPSGCKIKGETVTTNALKDEIVEGVGSSAGKVEILFVPSSGKVFAEPKLEGGFLCLSIPVEGSVLAEANPQKTEANVGTLKFEPANGKEYKNSAGKTEKAGLKAGGGSSTVTGEDETELNPLEKFGAF